MPYTFRIVYGGLCALVPREADHQLDILLVNTQHDRATKLNHVPPLHVPRLEFDLSDMTGSSKDVPPGTVGYWRLQFEELALSAKGPAQPLTFQGNLTDLHSGKANPPTTPNQDVNQNLDFSWIPDLANVCPTAGAVEAECFAPHPSMGTRKGFIVARMTLDRGVANVRGVSNYLGDEVVAQFVPKLAGSTAEPTAVPHLAQVAVDVDDAEVVTLTATRFDGKKTRTLHLGPPAKGKTAIEVHLTNLCCGGYLDADGSRPPKEDDDFESFYILCQNFNELQKLPRLPIPVPIEFATTPTLNSLFHGGGNPIACSMTRMRKGQGGASAHPAAAVAP